MRGTCETVSGQITPLCAHIGIGLRGVTDIIDLIKEPLVEHVSQSTHTRTTPHCAAAGPSVAARR